MPKHTGAGLRTSWEGGREREEGSQRDKIQRRRRREKEEEDDDDDDEEEEEVKRGESIGEVAEFALGWLAGWLKQDSR